MNTDDLIISQDGQPESGSTIQVLDQQPEAAPSSATVGTVEVANVAPVAVDVNDFFFKKAQEMAALTKKKAWTAAAKLIQEDGESDFELGGVLHTIKANSWFDGAANFDAYVENKLNFQPRKARYLIEIYENLVNKSIPWDKVKNIGWSKLSQIAKFLTLENLDSWVAKASSLSFVELLKLMKSEKTSTTTEATSNVHTMRFKLESTALELVNAGLQKAKVELNTESDSTALSTIMAGYIGGSLSNPAASIKAAIQSLGWYQTLLVFAELFPDVPINVDTENMSAEKQAELAAIQAQEAAQSPEAPEEAPQQ